MYLREITLFETISKAPSTSSVAFSDYLQLMAVIDSDVWCFKWGTQLHFLKQGHILHMPSRCLIRGAKTLI